MIDIKTNYSDQTIVFRRLKDGSLMLISLDGVVLEHITAEQLNPTEAHLPAQGILWALVFALFFWGAVAAWYLL